MVWKVAGHRTAPSARRSPTRHAHRERRWHARVARVGRPTLETGPWSDLRGSLLALLRVRCSGLSENDWSSRPALAAVLQSSNRERPPLPHFRANFTTPSPPPPPL